MTAHPFRAWVASAALALAMTAGQALAALPAAGGADEPVSLPRDLEIELALSALPPHLRADATVYVLNPNEGFELAREGTNGIHALVARNGDDAFRGAWMPTDYRDDILYPVGFDSAGADAILPLFFDAARMQAEGVPAPALKALIQERYASGYYKAPARAGISYMLSPLFRSYTAPEEHDRVGTVNYPHIMYYAPNVSARDVGGAQPGSPFPVLIHPGPHAYNIQGLGDPERQAINAEYAGMIERLCGLRVEWCLPGSDAAAADHNH